MHARATAHLNASLGTNIPCEILVLRGLLIAVTYAPLALTFDRASIIGWDHVLAEKHLSERWSHSLANHHFCELRPELQYDVPTVLLFWISECSGFLKFRGAGTWEMQLIVFLFSVKSAALERFILHEQIPNIPADSMAKFIRGRNTRDRVFSRRLRIDAIICQRALIEALRFGGSQNLVLRALTKTGNAHVRDFSKVGITIGNC